MQQSLAMKHQSLRGLPSLAAQRNRRPLLVCASATGQQHQQQQRVSAQQQTSVPLSQQERDAYIGHAASGWCGSELLPRPSGLCWAVLVGRNSTRPLTVNRRRIGVLPFHVVEQQATSRNNNPATLSVDSLNMLDNWADNYTMPDEMSLWDADGDHYSSRRDLSLAYSPPKSDVPGLAVALGLLTCWSAMFQHALWGYDMSAPLTLPHVADGLFTFLSLEFLSAGLFITTHDSMHGAITPNNRFLNDLIGACTVSLYAWFDYSLMWKKHWEHHNLCGTPKEDPDFHQGDPALLPWFFNFMKGYVSLPQMAKLFAITTALSFVGAPIPNQLLFWAGSGLLSSVRLFYFGTYLPHKPRKGAKEVMAWAKARSVDHAPKWLPFAQCYNFGMHWEHHRWPFAPWWDLPRARAVRYTAMGSLDD